MRSATLITVASKRDPLDAVFRPRSVAILGASADPAKRGYQAVRALIDSGFAGRIHPVNPRGGELHGLPVARSVAEIEEVPDLALICTPAARVPGLLEQCAAKGIPAAVVLALGFGEAGGAGAELEQQLRAIITRTGIRVVGPNTSGILNLTIGLNLIGARGTRPGGLALLVQSGNIALSLLNQAATPEHEGVSICAGAGNEIDLRFSDYLKYLDADPATKVILMYVEGFRSGRAFFDAARDPSRSKPIVVLKGGRSNSGSAAARSHTGVVAGEYTVVRAALRQAGVLEVRRTDELFPVAETLAWQPAATGGIAVLSDGGGHATLCADVLTELAAPLARLGPGTETRLRALLGPNAQVTNPVDLAGAPDAAPRVFAHALRALLDDDAVGGVLVVGLFGGYALRFAAELAVEEAETAQELARIAATARKPLVVHSLYAGAESEPLRILRAARVPVQDSVEIACRCIAASAEWAHWRKRSAAPVNRMLTGKPECFVTAREQGRTVLLEPEARGLVVEYGVQLVPARFCRTEAEVEAAMAAHPGNTVFKVVAPSLPHKTDAGGVALRIKSAAQAADTFRRMMSLARDAEGVLVAPMLPPPQVELLVGARRDAQFGPIVSLGSGGTTVELRRDVAVRLLPIDRAEVCAMLSETVAGRLLAGVRGQTTANRDALIELVRAVSDCLMANPELAELELNPVFVDAQDAMAVDVRAFLVAAP